MSIYHLSVKPIGRSGGRSATAAAAYRAAVAITDERSGLVHDYTRKGGVLHSELILPGGGSADRADFWNRVEAHHKRGDAVLVREVEISLPREITEEERQALAVRYARELADRYSVAADVALHAPRTVTDHDDHDLENEETGRRHNGNWHAHIMLSACQVYQDGTLGKKVVELDPIHCQRHKITNMVDRERACWSDHVNAVLQLAGFDERVDHRSFIDQGRLDEVPSVHLGPHAAAVERRTGVPSRRRESQKNSDAQTRVLSPRRRRRRVRARLDHLAGEIDLALAAARAELESAQREVRAGEKADATMRSAKSAFGRLQAVMESGKARLQTTPQAAGSGPGNRPAAARGRLRLRDLHAVLVVAPKGWSAGSGMGGWTGGAAQVAQFFNVLAQDDQVVARVAASHTAIEVSEADGRLCALIVLDHALKQGWVTLEIWGTADFKAEVRRLAEERGVSFPIVDAVRSKQESPLRDDPNENDNDDFDKVDVSDAPRG